MVDVKKEIEKAKNKEIELFGEPVAEKYRLFSEKTNKDGKIENVVPLYDIEFISSNVYINEMKLQQKQFYRRRLGRLKYLKQCNELINLNYEISSLKVFSHNIGSYVEKHNEFVEKEDLLRYKRMLIFAKEYKLFGEIVPEQHRKLIEKIDFRGLLMDVYPLYSKEYLEYQKSHINRRCVRSNNPIEICQLICKLDEIESIEKENYGCYYKKC